MKLNSDIGEAFGAWELADDEAIMQHLQLANVACGFHAGDPMVIRETVRRAKRHGVEVGAHPGYPDLQGFGRRAMDMDPEEITAAVLYQCGALKAFLDAEGMPLTYVKPHGALYGAGARDETIARAVADAAALLGVPVMGMAGKAHESAAEAAGAGFIAEYYADLEYDDDGFLIITRKHIAYDPEVAVRRLHRVLEEGVAETASGGEVPMRADTVCVHSDTPGAPELAKALADALKATTT
jgi:5-oxoprolinase (ATP-hydrolysing) subunit A